MRENLIEIILEELEIEKENRWLVEVQDKDLLSLAEQIGQELDLRWE